MTAFLLALGLLGHPSVQPRPIGPGPRYVPPAAPAAVLAGKPVGRLRCAAPGPTMRVHVEVFANRRVVVLPAGIGVAPPSSRVGGAVVARGCSYPLRTLTPTGIVEVARRAGLRLSDLFRIWGQPLGPYQVASFRSSAPVRVYVDGKLVRGPARSVPLTPHAEIVLELGGYVPPHPFFLFAGADS